MPNHTCPTCGAPKSGRRAYCSDRCRPTCSIEGCCETETNATLHVCETHRTRIRGGLPMWRTCSECGTQIEDRPKKSKTCAIHDVCSVEGCQTRRHAGVFCAKHYAHNRVHGLPFALCQACGRMIDRGPGNHRYCSEECRPMCSVQGCAYRVRGGSDICASHRQQLKVEGALRPARRPWTHDWICVVCGADVEKGSGRRKHCSDNCKQLDYAWEGRRPKSLACQLCGKDFSLLHMSGARRQRADTKWCPECGRDAPATKRYKIYGVTPAQYESALANGCDICGEVVQTLHVDHDHSCCSVRGGKSATCWGCVRGFLCGPCNRAIGMMKDDPDRLASAIAYLTKN